MIAESTAGAQALLDACAISAGQEVLDVAAGTGNLALLAAREGAAVVASDLTPGMVERGSARTSGEGYDVEWVVADVERAALRGWPLRLLRLGVRSDVRSAARGGRGGDVPGGRPGGTVGLASWAPDGFQGKVFAFGSRFVPMPEGVPVPALWGDEDVARERLSGLASSVAVERHMVRHEYDSPEAGSNSAATPVRPRRACGRSPRRTATP